jgi:hypothetical protein
MKARTPKASRGVASGSRTRYFVGAEESSMLSLLLIMGCTASQVKAPASNGQEGLVHVTTAKKGEEVVSQAMSDKDRIFEVFRASQAKMTACYLPALEREPMLYGELVVGLSLSAEGEATEAKLVFATIGDEEMQGCVLAKAQALQFPALRRDKVTVSYPYLFTTDRTPSEVVRALKVRHGLIPPSPVGKGDLSPDAEPARGQDGWYETW